ncbi:MAG: hypothetical protein QXU99_08155 [Candidatus Bathyarchaeia archaeon]
MTSQITPKRSLTYKARNPKSVSRRKQLEIRKEPIVKAIYDFIATMTSDASVTINCDV